MRCLVGVILALALVGASHAQPKLDPNLQTVAVPLLPAGAAPRPVGLTRLKATLRDNQSVGTYWWGAICIQSQNLTWSNVQDTFANLKDVFGEELRSAGFKPDVDPGSLFADADKVSTDLEIGAVLKGVDASYCESLLNISGKMKLDMEWQLYSNLRREVLATIETHEAAQAKTIARGAPRSLAQMAFAANVRALLSDARFRDVVLAAESATQGLNTTGPRAPITLINSRKGPTSLADATGSVVTIFAGAGFGSGALISADGLIITNHHVIAGLKTVKVRWSDGFETFGEVLRSDKGRDVALIRTDPHGRLPLVLRRDIPQAGATAFAIGTPLDPKLKSTVTRGIVSAVRIVDGFNFIQGDVPVTHGNSGGPLLDERGAVVGLTNWGMSADAGSTLNFFIPIGDALDFLGLKPAG